MRSILNLYSVMCGFGAVHRRTCGEDNPVELRYSQAPLVTAWLGAGADLSGPIWESRRHPSVRFAASTCDSGSSLKTRIGGFQTLLEPGGVPARSCLTEEQDTARAGCSRRDVQRATPEGTEHRAGDPEQAGASRTQDSISAGMQGIQKDPAAVAHDEDRRAGEKNRRAGSI